MMPDFAVHEYTLLIGGRESNGRRDSPHARFRLLPPDGARFRRVELPREFEDLRKEFLHPEGADQRRRGAQTEFAAWFSSEWCSSPADIPVLFNILSLKAVDGGRPIGDCSTD